VRACVLHHGKVKEEEYMTGTVEICVRNYGDMSEGPEVRHNPTIAEYYEQCWNPDRDHRNYILIGTIFCNVWQIEVSMLMSAGVDVEKKSISYSIDGCPWLVFECEIAEAK
jgi:hypothetical protein